MGSFLVNLMLLILAATYGKTLKPKTAGRAQTIIFTYLQVKINEVMKQAGAELCQAQLSLKLASYKLAGGLLDG